MEKKKDILVDVDEVIVFSGFVEAVNDFLGTSYVIDDFTEYYIDEAAVPKEKMDAFNDYLNTINLYDKAPILPDAIEALKKLNEVYNIYLLTSCVNEANLDGCGRVFMDKYNFLRKNLPFINPKNFIFTGSKGLFKAYAKIDNLLSNFNKDEDVEIKILFPSYHNKDITKEELDEKGVIRAGYEWRTGWKEVLDILLKNKNTN
jgi:5'(3')-deoxyribonucleotidase